MPTVRVLTTGGTIASRRGAAGVTAQDSGAELVATLPGGDLGVRVEVDEVFRIGSFSLSLADVVHLTRRVVDAAAEPGVDGVVVTHGTDTMEESAYLVDLAHTAATPVVFTGAQRAADEPDADGPRNLADAIRLAAAPAARDLGAVICMAGRAYDARNVTKVRTLALDAFDAPGYGHVAEVYGGQVAVSAAPRRPARFSLAELGELTARVDVVPLMVGVDASLLQAARQAGARGIVLAAFGAGNANPTVVAEVAQCVDAGIVVLIVSRCREGPVAPIYGSGGGVDLERAGAIFAGNLRAPKARLLLAAALGAAPDPVIAIERLRPHLLPEFPSPTNSLTNEE